MIDRRSGRADIDGREPAGIAMGEHIDARALFLPRGNVLDDFQSVPADRPD